MPRATKQASDATAAAIVDSARLLFAERGYRGVSLDEVAAAAGVTRGAVYHHYGRSQGVFEAVLDRVQGEVAEAIDAATAGVNDPWESLRLGSRAFLKASIAPATMRILLLDGPAVAGWERWRQGDAAHSARHLDAVMQELASAGQLRGTAAAASALLSGAMNEAALWIAESTDRDTALAEAWHTLQLLIGALRSEE